MNERQAEISARGSMSNLTLGHFREKILERRERIQKELVALYRGGELELPKIVGKLAELTMTYDLISDLERDVKQAQNQEQKLYAAGNTSTPDHHA